MRGITISRKPLAAAAVAGALAASALLTTSPAAHAASMDLHIFPLSNPFLYLDVSEASKGDGARIILWTDNAGANQAWYLHDVNGNDEIRNRNSGKCLTTDGVAGHQLYQWYCNDTPNQFWTSSMLPGGLVPATIRNPASGLVADVSGGNSTRGAAVIGWSYNGGSNQRWNNYQE